MFVVSDVALTNVVELTVIKVPEKVVTAPAANPVPVIVTFSLVVPRSLAFGVAEVTLGAALTVNTPTPVAVPVSGLVTTMFWGPVVAAPVIVMLAVRDVALTKVVEFTVTPRPRTSTWRRSRTRCR